MRIKKEAGNRAVCSIRSGFFHGEVSNTVCLFVFVVGFEAHTVCASTPFSRSVAPLRFGSGFWVVSMNFFPGLSLSGGVPKRQHIHREKVTARSVCVWTLTFTCVRVSAYKWISVCVYLNMCARACVHTRGSQTRKWLLENTCFSVLRVSPCHCAHISISTHPNIIALHEHTLKRILQLFTTPNIDFCHCIKESSFLYGRVFCSLK